MSFTEQLLLDLPPELLEAIFPFVEHELAALDDRRKKYGHVAEDFALRDFLTLLRRLRCVLLQDAAIIRAKYPTTKLMLFDYPPFNLTAFQTFSSTALFVIQEAEETSRNALSALPHVVAASMQGILTSISLDRQKSDHKTQALLEGLSQQLQVTMTSDHDQSNFAIFLSGLSKADNAVRCSNTTIKRQYTYRRIPIYHLTVS